ncbi:MAG: diguanylate cyclase [Paraglaciecola sp.]|uniref:GGDEF domain-containing protein n=1 Tax=Paraglaciecola sp. TaxID=1920173 RepID=UPI0032995EC0
MNRRQSSRKLDPHEQLGRRLGLRISFWALLVLVVASIITFFSTYPRYQEQVISSLKQDIQAALVPTDVLFSHVTNNANILAKRFLDHYQHQSENQAETNILFQSWFEQTSPGITRLKQVYFDGISDNHYLLKGISAFIGQSDSPLDQERKARIVAATLTLNELGPAWSEMVSNSHLSMPENALIIFSENIPWGRQADKDLIMTDYSVLQSSLQSENPEREPNWTGLYFDVSAGIWTITYQRPIDLNGKHLANASFDVELSKLLDSLQKKRHSKADFMLLNQQGDLIAASNISNKLKNQPLLNHDNYHDPLYQAVYKVIAKNNNPNNKQVFENALPNHLLILQPIPGVDWWYAALYPEDLIREQATTHSLILSITGLFILGLLLLIVHWQVTIEVSQPLHRLASVAGLMDTQNYRDVITTSTKQWQFKGEVKLALDAFRTMARRFVKAQHGLEKQVQLRTAELADANQRLQQLAHVDGLTGLLNRRSLDRDLKSILSGEIPHVLALADIDDFKLFNDHYGHEAGDRVLQQVGQCLSQISGVHAYRYGGEEFALLIPQSLVDAQSSILEDVVKQITQMEIPHQYNSRNADVISLSIGAAKVPLGQALSTVIKLADENLYKAKKRGGNCVDSDIR